MRSSSDPEWPLLTNESANVRGGGDKKEKGEPKFVLVFNLIPPHCDLIERGLGPDGLHTFQVRAMSNWSLHDGLIVVRTTTLPTYRRRILGHIPLFASS